MVLCSHVWRVRTARAVRSVLDNILHVACRYNLIIINLVRGLLSFRYCRGGRLVYKTRSFSSVLGSYVIFERFSKDSSRVCFVRAPVHKSESGQVVR